ncbi:MAG: Spy/CpxP family protein refolding chaperone [Bryobacteraceae bacterium]
MNTKRNAKNKWLRRGLVLTAAAAVSAGLLVAQGPGFGRGPGGPGFGPDGFGQGRLMRFAAHMLDLTDAQETQIKTIFQDSFQANEGLRSELKKIHEQGEEAVKANKGEAEYARIANSASPLVSQMIASHMTAMAKVYQVLTPAQREKAEKLRADFRERIQSHRPNHRRGSPPQQ